MHKTVGIGIILLVVGLIVLLIVLSLILKAVSTVKQMLGFDTNKIEEEDEDDDFYQQHRRQQEQRWQQQQQQNRTYTTDGNETVADRRNDTQRQKIFADDEGEYVEFEEY